MTHTNLLTVNPEDNLLVVQDIFNNHRIHHIPVVRFRKIVGMVSKNDFEHFMGGMSHSSDDKFVNNHRLERSKVEDIMTHRLAKLESTDRINVALEVFSINRFHALPVVDNDELVGILTPFDIMQALLNEKPAHPEDVYDNLPSADGSPDEKNNPA